MRRSRLLRWVCTIATVAFLTGLSFLNAQAPSSDDSEQGSATSDAQEPSSPQLATVDYNQEPGIIAGSVVDGDLGNNVLGAMVKIDGTTYLAISDVSGNFRIKDVPPGEYVVTVSQGRYQPLRVKGVQVASGEVANLDLALFTQSSDIEELDAFVVTFDDVQTGEMKLLGVRQQASTLSDALGAEAFTRLGVSDAAEAMTKITGASVVDGKYLLVRGLGDRYSNTLLNGATVPSADPDRRAVQMDQFPSEVLESIVTSKSFTPDQPGNFSGGSVDMRTKSFPDQFFGKVGFSIKYNTAATGKDVLSIPGGGTDWLAIDDGTRSEPDIPESGVPSATFARFEARNGNFGPAEELDRIINSFNNEVYFPSTKTGAPTYDFNFSIGDQIQFKEDSALGYIFSLNYSNGVSHYEGGTSARYSQGDIDPAADNFVAPLRIYSTDLDRFTFTPNLDPDAGNLPFRADNFGVKETNHFVNWGLFGQLAYKPSSNHEYSLRLLHNQSADDVVRIGGGENQRSEGGRYFEAYDMLYTERGVSSIQFEGKDFLGANNDLELNYRASWGKSTQKQPDFRVMDYFFDLQSNQFAQASGSGNNRYFRDLEEKNLDLAFDFKFPVRFNFMEGSFIKTGVGYVDGGREYRENVYRWSNAIASKEILTNYPGEVGIADRGPDFVLFANTLTDQSIDLANYDADKSILAGYLMADMRLNDKLRTILGLRAEKTEFTTTSPAGANGFQPAEIDQTDFLPALSLVYALNGEMNLRAAYGRTLARPQYRELAGITVVSPFLASVYQGNPDIEMSLIHNFDVRWEWFPRAGEIVAVSVFYKDLTKPIEVAEQSAGGRVAISPQNADKGKVYGIELEYRQSLDYFSDSLRFFSVGTNFALIESEVGIPAEELEVIRQFIPDASDTRKLIEQSPYTFNADITFNQFDWGTTATLAYNMVGDRLSVITNGPIPDFLERTAPTLDFIFSQELGPKWTLKFSAKNILNSDREKSVEDFQGVNNIYELKEIGTTLSLGFNYEFY